MDQPIQRGNTCGHYLSPSLSDMTGNETPKILCCQELNIQDGVLFSKL